MLVANRSMASVAFLLSSITASSNRPENGGRRFNNDIVDEDDRTTITTDGR